MLKEKYPPDHWIRAFTDGSASEAIQDGGGWIYIEWPDNTSAYQQGSIPQTTRQRLKPFKRQQGCLQTVRLPTIQKWFY